MIVANTAFCWPCLLTLPTMCFPQSTHAHDLAQYVSLGKGRQYLAGGMHNSSSHHDAATRAGPGYVLYIYRVLVACASALLIAPQHTHTN